MTIKLRSLKLIIIILLFPCIASAASIADSTATSKGINFVPKVHGLLRSFYQLSTASGESRFIIRNARLNAGGSVLPMVDYFLQVDFCDLGSIVILDAYAKVRPITGLNIFIGQMRVPFSVQSSRLPQEYFFVNRGMVHRLGNLRSVGIKAGYTVPATSLYFEGGIFNGSNKLNHLTWNSQLTYSIKANLKAGGFKPEVAFMSRVPSGEDSGVRFNQGNASLSWTNGKLFLEGEYIYRGYTSTEIEAVQAYSMLADYGFDVKWKWAHRISVQGRFDGITDGPNIDAHRRFTIGATAHYGYKDLFIDFRANFEQYFYNNQEVRPSNDANNKLIAGVILYF